MRVRHIIVTAVSALLAAMPAEASAQADATPAQPEAQANEPEGNGQPKQVPDQQRARPSDRVNIDILPLIDVRTLAAPTEDRPIGGYVRFYVCDVSQCRPEEGEDTIEVRSYGDEHRRWLSRWLIGRSFSRILTVKLSIARPNVSATTTLASSVLQSNRSVGETWDSEINGRRYLTPYLRVDPDTVVTVDVDMNAATAVQANITRAVLDVVGRAVTLVQPTAQLITSLNSERFRQTSQFIDESVSNLFAQNLAESTSHQFAPDEWGSKTLVEIIASFPMNRRLLRQDRYRDVGTWRVMATHARVSMFSDEPLNPPGTGAAEGRCANMTGSDLQACRAFVGLTPQRVLGLSVGENLTLGQALLADTAISGELGRLLAASGDADERRAGNRLCSLVSAKAEALGFNRYDAAAAVWAFSHDVQLEDNRGHLMGSPAMSSVPHTCTAGALARDVKLD